MADMTKERKVPKGLLEKDLVLDVSLRLGKLIEEKMGAEVIYTRSDDTFIPLEGRTALANEKKADLFLSIHANSSPIAAHHGRRNLLSELHGRQGCHGSGISGKRGIGAIDLRIARSDPENLAAR